MSSKYKCLFMVGDWNYCSICGVHTVKYKNIGIDDAVIWKPCCFQTKCLEQLRNNEKRYLDSLWEN